MPFRPVLQYDQIQRDWGLLVLPDLLNSGWITEIEKAESITLWDCPEHCSAEPIFQFSVKHGKVMGLHFCPDPDCGTTWIDPEQMRQWEIRLFGIAGWVHKLCGPCGLKGEVEELVAGRVCGLGSMTARGAYRELFLVRGMLWRDGASVIEQAKRLKASPAPAVITLDRLPTMEFWQKAGLHPAVISMSEGLQQEEREMVLHLEPLFLQPSGRPAATNVNIPARPQGLEASALAEQDVDVLEALNEAKAQSVSLVEVMVAAGYSKHVARAALERLVTAGLAARPSGTRRKGWSITQSGRVLLQHRASRPSHAGGQTNLVSTK